MRDFETRKKAWQRMNRLTDFDPASRPRLMFKEPFRPNGADANDVSLFEAEAKSIEALQAFNELPYALREFSSLDGRSFDIVVSGARSSKLTTWMARSNSGFRFKVKIREPLEFAFLQIPMRGQLVCSDGLQEHVVGVGQAALLPYPEWAEGWTSEGYEALQYIVQYDASGIQRPSLVGGTSDVPTHFAAVAGLDTPPLRSLQRNLHSTFVRLTREGGGHASTLSLLEEVLIDQLIGAWPQVSARPSLSTSGISRAVQRSLDYIEANLTRSLSVAEVAAAAGIGVRALQSGFRRDLGRTPIQHIIDRRLEQAHETLRSDSQSAISAIAGRSGFVHMSDFSRRYRQRFGCTPTETQIRAPREG